MTRRVSALALALLVGEAARAERHAELPIRQQRRAEPETPIDVLPVIRSERKPTPLTAHDTERLRLAQAERERKAAKLKRTGL